MTSLNYRPEIDGLRSVAVVPVVLFHAGASHFAGGFVGVDVFFVISGYLITTILFREINARRFRLVSFYERRARRLLPPLFVMLFITSIAAWVLLPPTVLQHYGQSLFATVSFTSNIYWMVRVLDYFASTTDPLLHTWSLSIEEQFYIFFPLLLGTPFMRGNRIRVLLLSIILVILGVVLMLAMQTENPTFAFFSLPTRMWELAVGSICAILMIRGPIEFRGKEFLATAGIIVLITVFWLGEKIQQHLAFYAPNFLTVLATALIILNSNRQSLVNRLLALRGMVFVGLLSYNIYLFHQPVLVFLHILRPDYHVLETTVALLVVFMLAWMTYVLVDSRCRHVRAQLGSSTAQIIWSLRSYVLGSFAFALVGLWFHFSDGVTGRILFATDLPGDYLLKASKNPRFATGLEGESCKELCRIVSPSQNSQDSILLFGDSHANDYRLVLANLVKERGGAFDMIINPGCVVNADLARCGAGFNRLHQALQDGQYSAVIIVVSTPETKEIEAQQIAEIQRVVAFSEDIGMSAVVALPRPELSEHPIFAALLGRRSKISANLDNDANFKLSNALSCFENTLLFDQSAEILKLGCGDLSCFDGHGRDGYPLYRDTQHLTAFGAERLRSSLIAIVDLLFEQVSE